jgi:hypothetical protein
VETVGINMASLIIKKGLPYQNAHISSGCGKYEHSVKSYYIYIYILIKQQFKANTKKVCCIYPNKEDNQAYLIIFVYMPFLFHVSQYFYNPHTMLLL